MHTKVRKNLHITKHKNGLKTAQKSALIIDHNLRQTMLEVCRTEAGV